MKNFMIVCTLAAVCMMGLAAAAAAPANFSGTWKLDKSKSQGLQGRMADADQTWTVKQDDKQLSVERSLSMGGQSMPAQAAAYNLDGSETTGEVAGRMPGKATRKAKWMDDGKILELHEVRTANFQGNEFTITTTEHWELADGGKTLKVHRVSETPQGNQDAKLTLVKE